MFYAEHMFVTKRLILTNVFYFQELVQSTMTMFRSRWDSPEREKMGSIAVTAVVPAVRRPASMLRPVLSVHLPTDWCAAIDIWSWTCRL